MTQFSADKIIVSVPLCDDHGELDYRWTSDLERSFLRRHGLIPAGVQEDFLIFRRNEILNIAEECYPADWQRFLLRRSLFDDDPMAIALSSLESSNEGMFQVGSVESAINQAKQACKQASAFNSAIQIERKVERSALYNGATQAVHYPASKLRKLNSAVGALGQYPIAILPNQYQTGYQIIRGANELEDYLYPGKRGAVNAAASTSAAAGRVVRTEGLPLEDTDEDFEELTSTEQRAIRTLVQKRAKDRRNNVSCYKSRIPPPDDLCGLCMKGKEANKEGKPEALIGCSSCENSGHPSCLKMSAELVAMLSTYEWQCVECKACTVCVDTDDGDKMLFCDDCDRGYHTFCVGLSRLPAGRWSCTNCSECAVCHKTVPGPKGSEWQHHFSKHKEGGGRKTCLQTLCLTCSSLFRRGKFCPSCLVVYRNNESDLPMICCDMCDRWIHTECDDIDSERYEELAEDESSRYVCLLCRGEQEEKCDLFHRLKR